MDEASARLEKRADSGLLLYLHHIRVDLQMICKTVNQHRLALKDVLRDTAEIISGDTALYFCDWQDHIQQSIEAADIRLHLN